MSAPQIPEFTTLFITMMIHSLSLIIDFFFFFFWWIYSVFAWDCLYCEFVHAFYGFNLQIQCRFLHLAVFLFYFILLQMILIVEFWNMQLLANMFMDEKDKTNLENKLWRCLSTSYMKLDENNDSLRLGYWIILKFDQMMPSSYKD